MEKKKAKAEDMPDDPMVDEVEEDEEEENQLPMLQAQIQPDAAEILGPPPQPDEPMEEEEQEDGSPTGEGPQVAAGDFESSERPALPYADTPEATYDNYIVSQMSQDHVQRLRQWTIATG